MPVAKRRSLEETLQALGDLRREPLAKESIRELRKVLRSKSSFAVAKAAQIAGEFEIGELAPDLAQAFDRFLAAPAESDKNCRAKEAIAEALYRLGHDGVDLFLRGIHHVQREPVWGGSVDSACALRGWCALGLVRAQYADAMAELADLLADPEPRARTGAIAALAASGREEAVLLLRFKALTGDEEPEVMADSLSALLELAPERSLDLVARFLHERTNGNPRRGGSRRSRSASRGARRPSRSFGAGRRKRATRSSGGRDSWPSRRCGARRASSICSRSSRMAPRRWRAMRSGRSRSTSTMRSSSVASAGPPASGKTSS